MARYVLDPGASGTFRYIEMRLPTKLAIVGVVLAGGTAAALLFRKTATEKPAEPQVAAAQADGSSAASSAPAAAPQGVPLPASAEGKPPAAANPVHQEPSADAVASSQMPPRLADSFPSPKETSGTAAAAAKQPPPPLPNLRGGLDSTVSLPADRRAIESKPAPTIAAPQPAPRPWRSHTVADGDTLSSLATRYLGSAGRFAEILDANRTILRSADMLPIGAVLRIPPDAASSGPPSPSVSGNRFDHLVPIPAGALSSRSAP